MGWLYCKYTRGKLCQAAEARRLLFLHLAMLLALASDAWAHGSRLVLRAGRRVNR